MRVDLHPEELFDRARRGLASPSELSRFEAHLMHCATCRFEFDLANDADWNSRPAPDDALRSARVRKRALATLAQTAPIRARPRRSVWIVAATAAALFFVAAGLAAFAVRGVLRQSAVPAPAPMHSAVPSVRARPDVAPTLAPSASADSIATAAPAAEHVAHVVAAPRTSEAVSETPQTAAALFTEANQARRHGDARGAARLYQELERRFPGSREALVSRVTLGRLLLDRLGDPGAALAHFNAYLSSPARGELEQEALIGRALALGRLGRANEERAAWTTLLRAYPHSAYADRAQARLQALP